MVDRNISIHHNNYQPYAQINPTGSPESLCLNEAFVTMEI
jgi:hypothetical protein